MKPWQQVDPRWRDQPGPIVDVGCLGWDWSRQFAGEREVVGYDPFEESCPTWARLHRCMVGPANGQLEIWQNDVTFRSGIFRHPKGTSTQRFVPCIAFSYVLEHDRPSIVKLNVEGGEYGLLSSVQHPVADQIVVSFHEWLDPRWEGLTNHYVDWLSEWYCPTELHQEWQWWLFTTA